MGRVARELRVLAVFLLLWIGISHTKTFTSFGVRFPVSCKGFVPMEDTNIDCVLCSTMCLIQFQKKDTLQSENQGVMIHSSGTQCMQIKIENDQVVCIETDLLSEETMIIVNRDLVTSMTLRKEPYALVYLGGVLKFAPVRDPQDSLPTFIVPDAPFTIGLNYHLAIINRGLMLCGSSLGSCFHWPFRKKMWNGSPSPKELHITGVMGFLKGQPIIVGGRKADGTPTDKSELFDPITYLWTDGPKLSLPRQLLSLVQVNFTTIIVVGGFGNQIESNTDLLSAGDAQWTQLEDRPEPAYKSCCGVVVLGDGRRGALSIGGNTGGLSSKAFFLDFGSMTWSYMASFNSPLPTYRGSLFQTDTEIHFMPFTEIDFQTKVLKLYVKRTDEPNEAWELRPYPYGEFSVLTLANPLTPSIYAMSSNDTL